MSMVVMHNVVSVDGFIADDNDDPGPLFEWYFNGEHALSLDPPMSWAEGLSRARRSGVG